MLKRTFLILLTLCLFIFVGCKCTVKYDGPLGEIEATGELDTGSGTPADDSGTSMGRGEVTMENGDVLEGELFDTDGDGKPDKFKPDAGQSGSGAAGETNGTDWFDIELDDIQQAPTPEVNRGFQIR